MTWTVSFKYGDDEIAGCNLMPVKGRTLRQALYKFPLALMRQYGWDADDVEVLHVFEGEVKEADKREVLRILDGIAEGS